MVEWGGSVRLEPRGFPAPLDPRGRPVTLKLQDPAHLLHEASALGDPCVLCAHTHVCSQAENCHGGLSSDPAH